jgi:L-ascorbate metabolism protein UlaG (beta-lactamase superfamily)
MKGSAGWDNPPPFIATPLNYTSLLAKAVPGCRPSELDWWQTLQGPGNASVQLVPALHWCRRSLFQTNIRLWGGYILRAGGGSLYFAGDTGYDPLLFADIRRRCGPPDVALLPIGAYEPRWFMRGAHMNPEEAVRAHRDLGARRSIAMHWGTIQLTDESIDAPVRALEAARAAAGMGPGEFQALSIGESVTI